MNSRIYILCQSYARGKERGRFFIILFSVCAAASGGAAIIFRREAVFFAANPKKISADSFFKISHVTEETNPLQRIFFVGGSREVHGEKTQ